MNGFRRGDLYHCPTRSPDLIFSDFILLWGWAKEEVYRRNPKTIQEVEFVIRDVLGNIPQTFLRKSNQHIEKMLKKCRGNAGAKS